MYRITRKMRVGAAITAVVAFAGVGITSAAGTAGVASAFHTVVTERILDTRTTGAPLGAASTIDLVVPGLPDDATAVSLNVTVTDGSHASFLVVYPATDTRPPTSSVNWSDVNAVANSSTVVVHPDHTLRIYNDQGTVNVVIDLLGFYSPTPVGNGATGATGPAGPQGAVGPQGPQGPAGTAVYAGPQWGTIDRNTIGSPVGALRSGPYEGASVPPLGIGSLGMSVKDGTEKVAFGNEVDFTGDEVGEIENIGFDVFWTGEDKAINASNLPNIALEVDPSGPGSVTAPNFSTLVFNPAGAPLTTNTFNHIDATDDAAGQWWFTGATGTTTGCNQTTLCTFAQLQTAVATFFPNMTVLTLAIDKGRDFAFNGAVDALVYNDSTFDFEPFGVTELATPAA